VLKRFFDCGNRTRVIIFFEWDDKWFWLFYFDFDSVLIAEQSNTQNFCGQIAFMLKKVKVFSFTFKRIS